MSIDETEWINEINKCMDQKEKWYLQRIKNLEKRNKRLQEQNQKAIALIKDGRFIEALRLLEDK